MARTRFDHWPCSVARTVDLIGDAWTALILRDAFYGVRRFEQLQANLGIGRNVLSQRLQQLVSAGIFERVQYQDRPPRYEHRLTDKGRDLYDVVVAMMQWGDRWLAPDGPPIELRSRATGERLEPVLVDARTGVRIDPREVVARPGPGFPEHHLERAQREGRFREG